MTIEPPSARLSPMQRTCLRLWYDRKTGGEIARELRISKSTVESHLAQARKVLGVSTSLQAAIAFHEYEGSRAPSTYPARVVEVPEPEPTIVPATGSPWWRALVPYKLPGQKNNELNVVQRVLWIIAIAFFGAASFGFLVVGLLVLTWFYKH